MLAIASIEYGGSLDGPYGVIQSPGFPEGTTNNECHWNIECGFDRADGESYYRYQHTVQYFGINIKNETLYTSSGFSPCSADK